MKVNDTPNVGDFHTRIICINMLSTADYVLNAHVARTAELA